MRAFLAASLIRSFCAAACCILLALQSEAADPDKLLAEYTHTVWTRKDGIPSAFIYSIAQTRDGYLWLATTDGLVRFDGVRFLHWRPRTGHTALLGVVRALCAGRDGSLWIGTASGLLGHLRGDELTTHPIGAQVEAIIEDRDDGWLWVTTENNLLRFRAATQEQVGTAIKLSGTFLSGPLQDKSGSIWFTTHSHVLRLDADKTQGPPSEVAKGKFWLTQDTNGDIWLTRPDGSTRRANEGQFVGRPETETKTLDIESVLRDSNGNTWIGTLSHGVVRQQAGFHGGMGMEYSQVGGLSTARVWCFFEDREHNIWVGTQNGLNRFRDEKITTLTRHEGLASDSVDALAAGTDGTIWASTSIGVNRIDGAHRDLYLSGTIARGLSMERGNTLWAGTNHGVMRMDNGKWSNVPMPTGIPLQDVTIITGDHENGVWLFDTHKGLHRWANGVVDDFSNETLLKGKSILAAHEDGSGRVWFGLAQGGLVVFDGGRFHAYSESDGLADGSVNTVHIDDQNTVWIGTDRGLSRFDGQRFVTWNITNGLPGERVLWILSDRARRIWLGYSTGVASIIQSELERAARDRSHRPARLDRSRGSCSASPRR